MHVSNIGKAYIRVRKDLCDFLKIVFNTKLTLAGYFSFTHFIIFQGSVTRITSCFYHILRIF